MADGVVVIAGLFQPGSVVTLTRTAQDVFRAEGGVEVSKRIVDDNGLVGWDELDVGAQYVASGYVNGWPVEQPVKATDAEHQSNDLNQAPPVDKPASIGTQEEPPAEVAPLPPAPVEGEAPIETGVPEGVSVSQIGAITYYICRVSGASSEGFAASGLQAPAEEGADGTKVPARPLYVHDGEVDLSAGEWEGYAGPTEPLGTGLEESVFSPPPPVSEEPPPEADVPPVTEPVPSESAGTGEAAGAPSEPPAPSPTPPVDPALEPPQPATVADVEALSEPAPAEPAVPSPAESAAEPATDGGIAEASPAPAQGEVAAAPVEPAADGSAAAPEPEPAPEASTEAPVAPAPEAEAPAEQPAPSAPADGGADTPA